MNMRELAIEEIMTSSAQKLESTVSIEDLHECVMKRFNELSAMSDEELFDELQHNTEYSHLKCKGNHMSTYELPDGFQGMETAPKNTTVNVVAASGKYDTDHYPFFPYIIGWAPIVPPKKKRYGTMRDRVD